MYLLEKSAGAINEVILGATSENGGTRAYTLSVGGEGCLPYQNYEGANPNRALVAAEVWDYEPTGWPRELREVWGGALKNPASWAKKAVDFGADMIYLKLLSADPDNGGRSAEECSAAVREVLNAVSCPIAVAGCGVIEYDRPLITKISGDHAGENLLIGLANQDSYATYAAACVGGGHCLIASSPLDINICKQTNILLSEMNMPANRIVIEPSIGALGYGLEYAYSILERGRIGALGGDKMLAMPVIGFIGAEAWKVKEALASGEEIPGWGDVKTRGVLWETITATSLIQSGMDILVMRHPEAMKTVKSQIDELMKSVQV